MIPVTIISGFLGSGKTTLLNHILKQKFEERVGVLVNDFGTLDIDGELVVSVEGETLALSGGCICCTIRTDLEETVRNLLDGEKPPARLIIEASGVSDPVSVAMTFLAGSLSSRCRVDAIVAMVDSESFFQTDPSMTALLEGQLHVADLVILNKMDVCPQERADKVEETIRSLFPRARLVRTSQARVPKELLFGTTERSLVEDAKKEPIESHVHEIDDHHHHHHNPHTLIFDSWSFSSDVAMDRQRLMRFLADLPPSIFRAKGFVFARDVPENEVIVHVAGRRVQQYRGKVWGHGKPQTRLVFIARQGHLDTPKLSEQLVECARPESLARPKLPEGARAWMERFESRLRAHAKGGAES